MNNVCNHQDCKICRGCHNPECNNRVYCHQPSPRPVDSAIPSTEANTPPEPLLTERVPEAARAAYTCFHVFNPANPLELGDIALYCSRCGVTVEGMKITPPVAYSSSPQPIEKCEHKALIRTVDGGERCGDCKFVWPPIKPTPEALEWEKEFDERYSEGIYERRLYASAFEKNQYLSIEKDIKDFIRTLLENQKKELLSKLEGMKKYDVSEKWASRGDWVIEETVYNQALEEIKQLLK